jgi:hypothetical protein
MWRAVERKAALFQFGHGKGDVGAPKIDAASRRNGVPGFLEQQPNAGTIEKGQIAKSIKLSQPENLFVKFLRTVHIADRERNLAYLAQVEQHRITSAASR